MSPRIFDRFMVRDDIGTNRKLRRLTPTQRWAFVAGVLPLASKSPLRGALLLTDTEPVTAEDIADESKVPLRDVRAMLEALRSWEMLERDEHGVEWVAGWDEINPDPKPSDLPQSTRERKRAQRERERAARAASHASHTTVTRDTPDGSRAGHDPEEEGEGKEEGGDRAGTTITGLHAQLPDVLAILRAAPDLDVEPAAVNSAISSRSDIDPLAAAGMVASWAHQGGLDRPVASVLLFSAFRKLADQAARTDGIRDAAAKREAQPPAFGAPRRRPGGSPSAEEILAAGRESA